MDKKHLLYGFLLLFFVGCGGESSSSVENIDNLVEEKVSNISTPTIKNNIAIQMPNIANGENPVDRLDVK